MAEIDVVSDILQGAMKAFPSSEFIQSLSHQYLVRGWLTKKQLQGLHHKAAKARDINPGKLATLEAMIARMPTRTKSDKPATAAIIEKDEKMQTILDEILTKYPAHKRVLFFKSKLEHNEDLSASEKAEAERFHKLLLKQ